MGNYHKKKGKGKLPIFCGNGEPVIPVYARWSGRSGTGGSWRVETSGHVDLRLAVGNGLGEGPVLQEVWSGILGGVMWVWCGRIFMMAVQGKLQSAPARTGAPQWVPEQERHHCILRGGSLWEVVDGTNCVGDTRKRSTCVGEAK